MVAEAAVSLCTGSGTQAPVDMSQQTVPFGAFPASLQEPSTRSHAAGSGVAADASVTRSGVALGADIMELEDDAESVGTSKSSRRFS